MSDLNKDLTDFGNDVEKFLKEKEIAVKKGKGDPKSFYGPIGDDPKKGGLVLGQGDTSLYIILNGDNVDLLNDVISRFNLKTLTKKENEGDLYIQDKPQIRGKAFEIEVRRFDPSTIKENKNNMSDNLTNYIKKVINEAKNPLAAKLKEVEAQGRIAALESKLAAIQEMIEETNGRLTRIDEDNEFSEMMDKKAVKEVRKQLKELERAEAKLQKEYDKVSGGRKKETVVDEDMPITNDEVAEETLDNAVDEVELEEDDLRFEGLNGVHDLKPMVTMNESIKRMQKLANLRD